MLSFQILDGGGLQDIPLEGRSVLIGSGPDCEIRLRSEGVAAEHARVVPLRREGDSGFKLIDLGSPEGTRVNGELVAQVALSVGDRIEIGGATLVLGKRVQRRATPDDVLGAGVRARLQRARRRSAPRAAMPWLAGVGAVVALAAGAVWLRGPETPSSVRRVPELLARGDYEAAAEIVEAVQRDWVSGRPERQQRLAPYVESLERQRRLVEGLQSEMERQAATLSVGDQIDELRRRESAARDDVERAAVRRVLSRLHDIRRLASPAVGTSQDEGGASGGGSREASTAQTNHAETRDRAKTASESAAPQPGPRGAAGSPLAGAAERSPRATENADAMTSAAEVREAIARGDLRRAAQLLESVRAPATDAADLGAELAQRVTEARAAGERQAGELVALGRGQDAAALLRRLGASLPDEARGDLEARAREFASVVPPPPPPVEVASQTPLRDPLGDLLRVVDAAEEAWTRGDFAAAETRFAEAAARVRPRDAAFADELAARENDCRLLRGLHEAAATALRTSAKPELRLDEDRKARLIDCDGSMLRLSGADGEVVLGWMELPEAAVDAILERMNLPAEASLGAAVLALAAGEDAVAERRLLDAVRKDAGIKTRADALLARVRGETAPEGGYRVEGGRFVSPALAPVVRELEGKLAAALRSTDVKARETLLSDVLARGPDQLEAVVHVLRRQQRGLVEKLGKHPFKKSWERVAAEREKLDAARAHALELIFDEERYFYPYKPPAVSSEKATEYLAVQREVNARVEAVADVWEKSTLRFTVPTGIAADLERLRWVNEVLDGFGERSGGAMNRVRWALTLPDTDVLDVKTFCRDPAEVDAARLHARIVKLNEKRLLSLSPGEREELLLTNAYRSMMGRRPLAVDLRVLAAARAHCEEMERLAYFGHISPVAENATPYDRMRRAGYGHGGSENIATSDSAVGAHSAWLHSSGHHRNILGVAHTEFACGQRGRLWTQNFGAGRDFESELPE